MSSFSPPVQRLVTELGKLPGIGGRTAQRLAFHLLRADKEDALALADAIREVKERIGLCQICVNLADGALSPIDGVDPEDLRIAELLARVAGTHQPALSDGQSEGIREVVLATNPTTTGEATALHIAEALRERSPDVTVTRLASGLPVGADLEYADELTLGRAFAGRRRVL